MESLGVGQQEGVIGELSKVTWAVGGGKGGVGKSLVAISLAYWLGRLKRRAILMDGDLGGANLHTMLGMRIPQKNLDDFILKRVDTLDDILLPTSMQGVQLLAGGSEVPALANPNFAQKSRILRAMQNLETDVLLVDLGAGTSLNTLDLFLACPRKLVVMTPQPTSIQNAYGFVKAAFYRRITRALRRTQLKGLFDVSANSDEPIPQSVEEVLEEVSIGAPEALDEVRAAIDDLRLELVVNMARDPKEHKVGDLIREVCKKFLGLDVRVRGTIPYDPGMEKWAKTMDAGALGQDTGSSALRAAYEIAYEMISELEATPTSEQSFRRAA
ncbi:MAG: P-loop NTPase [Candidatus Eisenbacteria bacterium]|nr:P-loop NTPase [Candidatus Eisenbacteria bacterium]